MQGLVHAQSTYYSFCQGLESGLHGAVHTYVSGDMANMYSSNDPLFYIHHANMDRHWWLWQTDNPSTAATWEAYPEQAGLGLSPSSIMSVEMVKPYIGDYPSTARIDEMYSVDAWCYTYGNPTMSANAPSWSTAPSTTSAVVVRRRLMKRDPSSTSNHYGYDNYNINNNYFSYPIQSSFGSSNGWSGSPYNPITPPSYDQTDLYNIRYQTPLPSSYINKMRLNETIIRRFESVSNSYVDHVNAVGGHVSRCALIHHHPNERHEYRVMSDSEHSSYRSHLKLIVDGFRQFSGLGDNLYTLAHH